MVKVNLKKIDMDYIGWIVDCFNAKYDRKLEATQDGDGVLLSLDGNHIFRCGSMQEVVVCYRTMYRVLDVLICKE